MARPERKNADYFPFYAKDGRTLFILEDKYGCKGTGFFTNVLRFLTLQDNHHFCIEGDADKLYFFSKTKCDEESGIDMLNIMAKTCKIHSSLWETYRVIVSQDLLESLHDAYRNRNNNIITIDQILVSYKDNHRPELKKGSEIFMSDSVEYRLANYLLNFILRRNPDHKKPDLQKWAKQIDLMLRADKRNPDDIKTVIKWCQSDTPDKQPEGRWKGWANNILSTKKLRDKFDKLFLRMKESSDQKPDPITGHNLDVAGKFLKNQGVTT